MTCPFHSFFALCASALAFFSGTVSAQTAIDALMPQETAAPAAETQPLKIAVLLPTKDSPFYPVTEAAVNGILASNYATTQPAEILLIHPDSSDNILHQAQKAAAAGAMRSEERR